MNDEAEKPSAFQRVRRFFTHGIWRLEREDLTGPIRYGLVRVLRVGMIAGRGFMNDHCMMRAGSLTYVTIFSLVPLLAVSFAVAKGLNADEALQTKVIEPFLDETFGALEPEPEARGEPAVEVAPAPGEGAGGEAAGRAAERPRAEGGGGQGPPAAEAAPSAGLQLRRVVDQIFAFVRKTNFTSLGAFSLVFLLYCVVKLLGATERTLNDIWGVRSTRSFTRRVTNYVAIVVMTPLVAITATAFTALLQGETYARLQRHLGLDVQHDALIALLPFLVVAAGMTFLYLALPNTRVRLPSALLGGIVAGFLWQLAQMLHIQFQLGVARINAIYSGFAAIPLFLLWIYVNWNVLLLGAEIAHAHESEPIHTSIMATGKVDQSYRERLALRLALRVTDAFLRGLEPPEAATLAAELGVPPRTAVRVLDQLAEQRLLVRTDEDPEQGWLPARSPDTITAFDVLGAMRREPGAGGPPTSDELDEGVDRLLETFDRQLIDSPHNKSLSTLCRAHAGAREGVDASSRPVGLSGT